jgi:tRNA modification GTPase
LKTHINNHEDTICAQATVVGIAAIHLIRITGKNTFEVLEKVFFTKNKKANLEKANTIHFGLIKDQERIIDEVLVSIFKNPNSYTGEDTAEISCHGSQYVAEEILKVLFKNGVRQATAGEFTLRAFINGKMPLSKAEAVADVIASNSKASHQLAIDQLRGGFTNLIESLREELINFASLIELELDFAEEDVEFADRTQFVALLEKITQTLKKLIESFDAGNAIKNGIPVVIVGEPNVGKSTLLNTFLNEERAIVSDIAGTTRDTIEDEIIIKGVMYRFIDTAGIRETKDTIESLGITKTFEKINQAKLILLLFDAVNDSLEKVNHIYQEIKSKTKNESSKIILIANKCDKGNLEQIEKKFAEISDEIIFISALNKTNIETITNAMHLKVTQGILDNSTSVVTNIRHFEALSNAFNALEKVKIGIDEKISSDFLAMDIRESLFHLGLITGNISTDDLLGNIFSKFCIGK